MHEYHIHVDATFVPVSLERKLESQLRYARRDFAESPTDDKTHTPELHYTIKPTTGAEFRSQFRDTLLLIQPHREFVGYVEGEFIPEIHEIPERTFDASVALPFQLSMGSLPQGRFRQSEVHVTMSYSESDPRLRAILLEMGLFPAFYPKPWGLAQIFTMQGTRSQMAALLKPLLGFLQQVGGSARCRVKEERIARWWMSSPDLVLPPVIDSIRWGSTHPRYQETRESAA